MFNRKQKTVIMLLVMALLASFTLFGCGQVSTNGEPQDNGDVQPLVWKIGIVDPEDYYMTQLTIEWAKMIEERSNGRVKTEIFHSGQLGGDVDMLQSLEIGTLQVWEGGNTALTAVNSIYDAWAMPYLYDSKEHQHKFWDNNFEDITEMLTEETGYRIVCVLDGLNRQLSTARPIETLEDLKGLKLRVPEVNPFMALWKKFGASPVAMPFTEVYTALQTGVVDGQENDILLTYDSGFFDVIKNLTLTEHHSYEGFIVFHESYYQTIPEGIKEIIRECSQQIMMESRVLVAELEDSALDRVLEKNVNVITPDLESFVEKGREVYADYPHIQPILDLIDSAR